MRLKSSVFISAPQSTTPFHFDPEVNFFAQIEGEKIYHLYEPSEFAEDEVEPLYVRATTDIGQVDLGVGTPAPNMYSAAAGLGFAPTPRCATVGETVGSRSISYTFVYETGKPKAVARALLQRLSRRLHLDPARPGEHPAGDAIKAAAMAAAIPVRRGIGKMVRSVLRS